MPDSVDAIFPLGRRITGGNFAGTVWVEQLLTVEDATQPVQAGNVTFEPRARSHWHHHLAGQSLLVLGGVGYYRERGSGVRVLRKGERVQCPPGVEHWHGAADDS